MKKFKLIICILSSLCLPVQAVEQQWLELFQQYNIDTKSIANYFSDNKHSLWLDNQQLTAQAHDALDFIAGSANHGLRPDDYHFSTLRQLDPSFDQLTAQRFDILLTDGLLKLIHDLSVGRLNASDADPRWFIPQQTFDANDFLRQALLSDHLSSQLMTLIPDSKEHYRLVQAMARYQRYVDRGGWSTIAETPLLRPNDTHQNIPAIQARLAFEDGYLGSISQDEISAHYDPLLELDVRRFQKKYSLKVDGIIGAKTLFAMNVSARDRLQQIKTTLERHRWLPDDLGQRYLIVNLASYKLTAIENGDKKLDMRVIVGRKSRPTPSFVSKIDRLVYNPFWNVPRKLARLDLLPKQQQDPNYFEQKSIRVFTIENGRKIEHNPYAIDWELVTHQDFPYVLRQDPGEKNALGKIKFLFPNPWSIYLHDTPNKKLFTEAMRSISSGCIRVADPIALANFSLADNNAQYSVLDMIASNKNRGHKLVEPLAIYAVYFTVWLDGDEVRFTPDVYQSDKRIAELL